MFAGILVVAAMPLAGCYPTGHRSRVLTLALAVFPGEADNYRKFVKDFERREHVSVDIVAQSYADILHVLAAQARAGRGTLDLVELDLAMLGQAQNCVRNLDAILSPRAHALFPEAAWDAATASGHIRFVPHRLMWQAMIYNRTRILRPPKTWAELREFSRKHPGRFALKAARYEGLICDVMPFVWAAGGDQLYPGSPGSLRALSFLGKLGAFINPQSAVLREMSVLEAQARGSVWLHFNWPFAMAYLASKGLAPSVNLSAPIPAGPNGSATPLGGGYLGVPVSAPHPKLAMAFIRYLLSADVQRRLSRRLGWYGSIPPPAGSIQAELYRGFTRMRPYVRARPVISGYARLSNMWRQAIRAVLFRGQTAKAALERVDGEGRAPEAAGTDGDLCR